jgi:transposase
MQKFKPVNNEQLFLLPPSIEDFIPAGHLARVINDVVETIDVKEIESRYSFLGQKSYHPHLLLKLLFYGYSTAIRSGRKIAAACEQDTAFMYLSAMYKPDFRTINSFRKNNIEFIQQSFVHIVQLCKGLGMCKAGMLILDGTKLKANASAERTKNKEQYDNGWSV